MDLVCHAYKPCYSVLNLLFRVVPISFIEVPQHFISHHEIQGLQSFLCTLDREDGDISALFIIDSFVNHVDYVLREIFKQVVRE